MKHREIIRQMTLEEKCRMLSGKDFWHTVSLKRLGVGSLCLSDGPHGLRKECDTNDRPGMRGSVPATCFPTAATMANSWDPALGEEIGRMLGEEAASQGVDVLLGPGLNIKRHPFCGRNFEYFSEDPYLAGKMAAGYVRGIQENGVAACLKHFAANNIELRRMASNSVLDERTLREIYLTNFEIAVKEGHPKAIMASYNMLNSVYANENPRLLTDILRSEWGFDGIVMSDWGACNEIVDAVRAGCDLEMPSTFGDSPQLLLRAASEGRITQDEIDQRVDELLDVILTTRATMDRHQPRPFDVEAHHAFAQKCSEQSIILLKNEDGILPLKKGARVAVIGDFAQKARYQGAGSSIVNCTRLDHTMDVIGGFDLDVVGFEPAFSRDGTADRSMITRAVKLAKNADYVLLYMGLSESSEAEGVDRSSYQLPKNQIDALRAVSNANRNVIVVMSAGSPVEMPWLDRCRAMVHGYLCGQAGASAVLRVITGAVNPSGKLSESYPLRISDCPSDPYFSPKQRSVEYREGLYVGYRYYETAGVPVLFPFGFGLSYTTFTYSDLCVTDHRVTFTVTNTGAVDGAEIAQLYVHAKNPSVYRPAKELKGFQKIFLRAGESKTVAIDLDDKAFRYFNIVTNRFEIDGGEYEIMVGASVADIRLSAPLTVAGTNAPRCEDRVLLSSYYSASIGNVSDTQFEALLGNPIPDGTWSNVIGRNDVVAQFCYAKSLKARLLWKIADRMYHKRIAQGGPYDTAVYVYNTPVRAIGKLSSGRFSQEMCDGALDIVNGHAIGFFKGMSRIIRGYFRQKKIKRAHQAAE